MLDNLARWTCHRAEQRKEQRGENKAAYSHLLKAHCLGSHCYWSQGRPVYFISHLTAQSLRAKSAEIGSPICFASLWQPDLCRPTAKGRTAYDVKQRVSPATCLGLSSSLQPQHLDDSSAPDSRLGWPACLPYDLLS